MNPPPVIKLRFEIVRKARVLTDGVHLFWKDGNRVRWALVNWPDDGLGTRTHGAGDDLLWAIEDAWSERMREP